MQHRNRWITLVLIGIALLVAGCGGTSADEAASKAATVEPVEGTDFSRIILSAKAAERLDIQTGTVVDIQTNPAGKGTQTQRTVIPYAAVLYEPNGETYAYTNPEPLTFVRQRIVVDYIDGDVAVLSDGPASGTRVATVGVAELFGAESGLGQ